MISKNIFTAIALLSVAAPALARRGGDAGRNRTETISCQLQFDGQAATEANASGVVQNASVLLRGSARSTEYVFSVRGKTAVAKLTLSSGQVITAQGAIEMLRHGGETDAQPVQVFRRGEDDASNGQNEREAGFDLSTATANSTVKLRCVSMNQTGGN